LPVKPQLQKMPQLHQAELPVKLRKMLQLHQASDKKLCIQASPQFLARSAETTKLKAMAYNEKN
jgi:hypothetical protein